MASKKGFNVNVDPEKVVHTSITRTKDYSSARMAIKVGDKAYMTIGVEWEGEVIPDFAMNMMQLAQANEIEVGGVVEGMEEDYEKIKNKEE